MVIWNLFRIFAAKSQKTKRMNRQLTILALAALACTGRCKEKKQTQDIIARV